MSDSKNSKVHIYLKFYDFNFHPKEISRVLNLEPTRFGLKGETYFIGTNDQKECVYETNYWELSRKYEMGEKWVQEFIEEFITEIIEPRKKKVKEIIKMGDGEFSVVPYFYSEANPGFFFERGSIDILSAANLSFNLDIYSL